MKLKKFVPLILICCIFSGCWDKVEIDRKTFISILGVDAGEQIDKKPKEVKSDEPYTGMNVKKLHITLGAPDISKLGPDKGGTAEDIYIDTDAYSMEDAISKASAKSSRTIKFSHIKLLVLSNELLYHQDALKEIVDYLQRQPSLDRMMMVTIGKGKTEDYIKYKPKMEKNVESYITGLVENDTGNAVVPVTLNEFLVSLNENGNAVLPAMEIDKDKKELKISGVGIIKDYRLKGYLSPTQTANLQMLKGKLRGGKKAIYKDGHPIDVSFNSTGTKVRVKDVDGKLVFNVYVNLEGELKEYHINGNLDSKDELNLIEKDFNKSLKEECEQLIKVTQNEFQVDPVELKEYVRKYHPAIWSQKKNNWPETYKNSVVNVDVTTKIRRIGVSK
ncbi:Ger(x)C family spore germination protein [Clostridium muellerianum]|uniref:Ger(x)C family spore germination protein n=1 Tax=Clostridium muellerianum TaxID=2716538 RepID=UPI001FABD985|nr:Ger(x)C family spore germination protein [Clostridium muellerianum]